MTPQTLPADAASDSATGPRPAARAAVVLVATLAAGMGAAGIGRLLVPPGSGEAWAASARLVGWAALLVGSAGLWAYRRSLRPLPERGPDPTISALTTAGTIMTVVAVAAFLMPAVSRPGGMPGGGRMGAGAGFSADAVGPPPPAVAPVPGRETRGAAFEDDPDPAAPEATEGSRRGDLGEAPDVDLGLLADLGNLLLVLLVVAVVLAGVFGRKRRRRSGDDEPDDEPLDPSRARAGLEASLDELSGGHGAPAERIVSAYYRLLEALEAAGAHRQRHEAPHEHLRRVLRPLGVPTEAMHRLAALYVAAEFGPGPVTDEDRAAAAAALTASLNALDGATPRIGVGAGATR